ncbi:MAG: BolA family transcriptional regulator [Myxococcales bacterium]|nr:MAG: BolA family transcriptional regulator [Myxococcales bacterium]
MVEASIIEERLREAFPEAVHIAIEDLTGTKDHYSAMIAAPEFENKNRIEQHKLVYAALGELMDGAIHALSLQTFTPGGWAARGQSII